MMLQLLFGCAFLLDVDDFQHKICVVPSINVCMCVAKFSIVLLFPTNSIRTRLIPTNNVTADLIPIGGTLLWLTGRSKFLDIQSLR